MKSVQLKKDIYWLGVLDPTLDVFDIIMETKYGTTYNSFLVQTSAGAVLVETVKEKYFDQYLQTIEETIGDLNQIKYIITNHTEPDHAGSIGKFISLYPEVTVIGSRTALMYLKDIINQDFKSIEAESLQTLELGGKSFEFIPAPFLHWPDSMYTYLSTDNVLFTCDSFGSHYSPKHGIKLSEVPQSEELAYQDALLYYYTAIFSPFKKYVLSAIDKISTLPMDMICCGHGPVLDTRLDEIIQTYKNWSTEVVDTNHKKVVIPYVSAYGYTKELVEFITSGIKTIDSTIEILSYDINILNYPQLKNDILAQIAHADGILFGTSTINGDALPLIWDLAISLNPIVHGGKVVSAFGSYGWSGEGVDNIINRLDQLRMHVLEGFKIKFKPSEMNQNDAIEFGRLYAKCLLANEVPKRPTFSSVVPQDINPSGEVTSWRCIICGEIYEGVLPPEVCPACGVGSELFEQVDIDPITFTSTKNERFVIIGGGVAAVSAAEAIRARNTVGSITILSQESVLPYYRPLLSDTISQDVTDEEFYLHPESYYTEQTITVQLNTTVQSIDVDGQFISLENGETVAYDKLIMATGSQAFIPPFKGANLDGVFSIKYKQDADNLRLFAKDKSKAVIVGGGVLGLEAADALLELGLHVTVIEGAPSIMPRQLDATASNLMYDILTKKGIDVHLGATLKEIVESNGTVSGVMLDDKQIEADLVVINVGVRANTTLAREANLTTDRGIVVNEHMQTSVSTIYACGDVAQYNDLNVSLWSPAIAQGKVAGANACGDNLSFEPLAEPLSLIAFDTEVFSIGTYPTSDLDQYQIITDSNTSKNELKKLYFKDDQLVYGVLFNNMAKANVLLNGIRKGHTQTTVISNLFN